MKRSGSLLIVITMMVLLFDTGQIFAGEHVIERGETALQIAIDHNLTMEQLQQLNPGIDLEMMLVGDILTVPEDGSSFDDFLSRQYNEKIRITDLSCNVASDSHAVCLFHAENISALPLYEVSFHISIQGTNGAKGDADGNIALMQILPGEKLPVVLSGSGNFTEIENASGKVTYINYSEMLQSSFRVDPALYSLSETFLPDRVAGTVSIQFNPDGIEGLEGRMINVLAAAYDVDENLIGVRSLYSDFYPRLDITVYSDDQWIDSVAIRLEAY